MRRAFLAAPLGAALLLAACGGSSSSSASSQAAGSGATVTAKEVEYSITPTPATIKAGSVTITAMNAGATTHQLTIEGNGISEKGTSNIAPGASANLTVDLKPGTYTLYCAIPGHEAAGMKTTIIVQ
jgi:uncharacterized cupredoxin-like copper-binding protein